MGLLVGAGLLVCVIGGFLWYGHHKARGWLAALPKKYGLNIKSESGEVSYSHSVQGKTLYTIHAAKQVEYNDGKVSLHDVDMVLCGKNGDRADRISGKEFEYEQATGVVRAIGEVHIDLQAPAANAKADALGGRLASPPPCELSNRAGVDESKVIHVVTSGLVYLEKLGLAATDEPIEFHVAQLTGHAIGADYESDTGVLVLHKAVNVTGLAGGRPVHMTATRALLDQRAMRTDLTEATYDSPGETVQADGAVIYTRSDGSAERIEAKGNVRGDVNGAKITSANADALLNAKSQPERVHLMGGVGYESDEPVKQARGKANDATIGFDGQGQAKTAVFVGGVDLIERVRASEDVREPWSTRELTAAKVELALLSPVRGKSEVRDADATGAAHLTLVSNGSVGKPLRTSDGTTELLGDELKAHLGVGQAPSVGMKRVGPQLETVVGVGHTALRQATVGGAMQTSAGDTLDAKFRPGLGAKTQKSGSSDSKGMQAADELESAVQQGHVAMMRRAPAKVPVGSAAKFEEEHATAERATYVGDLDRLTLVGGVQLTDADSVLWANQVAFDHATGNARAEGAVKVSYQQAADQGRPGKQPDPAHILADHAELKHDENVAIFYGRAGQVARLWQGGSQVEAAVLELSRDNLGDQRLFAHGEGEATRWGANGDGPAGAAPVHAVLVNQGQTGAGPGRRTGAATAPAKASAAKPGTGKDPALRTGPSVLRVASRELVYSDMLQQADFTGGVRVDDRDGTLKCQQATAYMTLPDEQGAAATGSSPKAAASQQPGPLTSFSGSVERVIATGHIDIEQPGRTATGERLVYTASDGWSVLTGTATVLAKLVDVEHGPITGVSLRFHAGDDAVLVSNALPGTEKPVAGQVVHSETRVKSSKESKPQAQKR
jgi:lipopolysaccharide export system protein LptA